jgi:hypothetical protein
MQLLFSLNTLKSYLAVLYGVLKDTPVWVIPLGIFSK